MQATVTNWADTTGGGRDCGRRNTVCFGNLREGRFKHRWQDDIKVDIGVKKVAGFWGGLICHNIGTSGWLLCLGQRSLEFRKVSFDVLTS